MKKIGIVFFCIITFSCLTSPEMAKKEHTDTETTSVNTELILDEEEILDWADPYFSDRHEYFPLLFDFHPGKNVKWNIHDPSELSIEEDDTGIILTNLIDSGSGCHFENGYPIPDNFICQAELTFLESTDPSTVRFVFNCHENQKPNVFSIMVDGTVILQQEDNEIFSSKIEGISKGEKILVQLISFNDYFCIFINKKPVCLIRTPGKNWSDNNGEYHWRITNRTKIVYSDITIWEIIEKNAASSDIYQNDLESIKKELLSKEAEYDLTKRDGEYEPEWHHDFRNGKGSFDFNPLRIKLKATADTDAPLNGGFQPGDVLVPFEYLGRFLFSADIEFTPDSEGQWSFGIWMGGFGEESPLYLGGTPDGNFTLFQLDNGLLKEEKASNFKINESNHIEWLVSSDSQGLWINEKLLFSIPFDASKAYGWWNWNIDIPNGKTADLTIRNFELRNIHKKRVSELTDQEKSFFHFNSKNGKLEIPLVSMPKGSFMMGHPEVTGKQTRVTLSPFMIGKYPVTYGEWNEIAAWAENNGYKFEHETTPGKAYYTTDLTTLKQPASQMTWYDMFIWCNALSEYHELSPVYWAEGKIFRNSYEHRSDIECRWNNNGYRLPTEAEWEYAVRSGGKTPGNQYGGSPDPYETVFFNQNGGLDGQVDTLQPNPSGLYDMNGNINESCWDWLSPELPEGVDPKGPDSGTLKVIRGSTQYSPAFPDSFRELGREVDEIHYQSLRVVRRK